MVDVAHDHNDRRTGDQIGLVVLVLFKQALLDGDMDLVLDLGVELLGHQGGGVKVHHVGSGVHLAHLHELGHDLGDVLLQAGSQLADGDLVGDGDLELGVAGLLQLDALQALGLGLAAALVLVAAAVFVVELLLVAHRLVLALGGHIAAVGQVVVAGAELVDVHVHGTGIHLHMGALDLHRLGGHRLLDAGVGGQGLHGHALFLALFGRTLRLALVLRLAGLLLLGGGLLCLLLGGLRLGLRRLRCGRLCRLGRLGGGLLGRRLVDRGKIGVQAGLGGLAGQLFQQVVQLLLVNGAAGLFGLAGDGGQGIDDLFIGYAKILGDVGDLILKLHGRVPPSLGSDVWRTGGPGFHP